MVDDRPLVEKLGLVLPSLNAPHSGWPLLAHPSLLRASASRSANPIGVSGQPSASAIGRGMAITSGVTMNGLASGSVMARPPLAVRRWFTTAPHERAAGDQITGRGPFAASSGQPLVSRSAPTPDDMRNT